MNRIRTALWSCTLIASACAWFVSDDAAMRVFFATLSGFGSGVVLHFCIAWFVARRRPS
jgi:hypothetical protein